MTATIERLPQWLQVPRGIRRLHAVLDGLLSCKTCGALLCRGQIAWSCPSFHGGLIDDSSLAFAIEEAIKSGPRCRGRKLTTRGAMKFIRRLTRHLARNKSELKGAST